MPENDFEKNVQDKMQGFDLNPSADLWNKVENQIRKDKKRRFIIWWPLGLLLLGGGIGLAIWLNRDNKKQMPPVVAENKSNTPSKINTLIEKAQPLADTLVKNIFFPVEKENFDPVVVKANKQEKENESNDNSQIKQQVSTEIPAKNENPTVVSNPLPEKNKTEPVTAQQPVSSHQPVTETQVPAVIEPGKKKEEKEKKDKITQWGLGVSAGRSAIVDGFGRFSNRLYSNAQTSSPTPVADPQNPITTKGHFSFSAELFMKRPISPKLDIIASMSYQYLSTRLLNNNNYTNQYHFATLSGELSWRFSGKKSDFRWNNGLSYNRLLGSSMLHYNGTIPGYYKDNKLLSKNHLFINTSLSLPVGKRVTLNPFASYGLTTVLRNASDTSKTRFSNFGLRLRFLIDRKK